MKKKFAKVEKFFSKKIKNLGSPKKVLYTALTTGRHQNRKFLAFWIIDTPNEPDITTQSIFGSVIPMVKAVYKTFLAEPKISIFLKKNFRLLQFFFFKNQIFFFQKKSKI